jgi:peptide/nickel transport system substrate-binding protein
MPRVTTNQDAAIENGTLEIAIVNDAPFAGLFSPVLSQDAFDARIMQPTGFGTIFEMNPDGSIKGDSTTAPAQFKLDRETRKATITLHENLKWSDGTPVTADDIIGTYKIIADADYTGVRFSDIQNVVGVQDFHDGKSDTISGITRVDDRTVTVEYIEVSPSIGLMGSGGQLNYIIPWHQLKDIPVANLESSDAVRKNPLSFGPFVISNVVPGESVEFVRNEHFFGSTPKLEKIIVRNTASSGIIQSIQAGTHDIVMSMPTDSFMEYKDTANYEMLGAPEMSYTYIGFRLGKHENNQNIMDPNAKMGSKELRQAMGFAVDNAQVGERFYHGLRTAANTLITPTFGDLSASRDEVPGYGNGTNMDKANQLLDDAGFKKGSDGKRTNQNGEPLVINFASMSGGDIAEPLAQYYIQQWQEIGLNVQLTDGRLLDFQTFYDRLQNDDPNIDVFMAAWSIDWNPDPNSLWGPTAAFNFTRYVSDENTRLINAIGSEKAFDENFRRDAFLEWQKYAAEQAFALPTLFRSSVMPVHSRVTNFNIDVMTNLASAYDVWANVGVTSANR